MHIIDMLILIFFLGIGICICSALVELWEIFGDWKRRSRDANFFEASRAAWGMAKNFTKQVLVNKIKALQTHLKEERKKYENHTGN